ncbi:Hypothetical predicted protein [Mytilus galloprovincialis]|uniref:Uncharacterized protein n=1 Tax=Mytilus galloprovincialis TaxID=29158 RepID=A0A8B6CN62_MYTGA|nr:Hypothetical predicted protein [Mytilus galloprovincialis]
MTPNNDLLIVTEATRLKQIKSQASKITDTIFDFEPYEPVIIHVTRKYKIIVGVLNTWDNTYLVFVMNPEGNKERVYGDDPTKDVSFTQTLSITDTSNDNIFVIDTTNDEEFYGNVKVLGVDDIINTYSGHSAINTEHAPFTPSCLSTTPADNVIIADTNRNALHILNASGELITYIRTADRGITFPRSLCIAMAGQFCILYIGTSVGRTSKDNGKLYKLNITGI